MYDVEVLKNLIDPLYKDVEDLQMFVYATFTGLNLVKTGFPTYDKPVYKTTDYNLPENIFQVLYDGILVPQVEIMTIDTTEYIFYSQAVPKNVPTDADGNPDRSKISFYLIFMLENDKSFSIQYESQIMQNLIFDALIILMIVLFGFSFVLFLIIFLTIRISRRIISTIKDIDHFTTDLKTKTDLDSKRQLIDEFSRKEIFQKISEQYDKMQAAKQSIEQKRQQKLTGVKQAHLSGQV